MPTPWAYLTDISILIAAQRPAVASPAGQGQQQPPLGYQGWPAAAAPTPPAPTVGYSLPKPISSGSVDLSSIRPVNSGSVSLEDAVARAKGFATERGVVLDRGRGSKSPLLLYKDDLELKSNVMLAPLGGDRRGQHPRSRSRSPIRGGRDSFRDNYNPYRDERREDARRPSSHNYSRDRSFSPSGGGLPGRPPLPSRYGHAEAVVSTSYGGDESASETITIDSNLVGLIIGRQGENLRRVEAETSTRVQFVSGAEAVGPQRQCKITGIRMARESAKAEIARIIEENAKATRDNVPADRMLAAAKSSSNSQPTARPGEDTTQILVPNRTVGLIIGRGGETIRDIQEKSGCHVNIVGEERSVNGQRPVNLIGSPSATAHATSLIDQVVMSDTKLPAQDAIPSRGLAGILGSDNPGGERINDTLLVPSEAVGMIIGKGKLSCTFDHLNELTYSAQEARRSKTCKVPLGARLMFLNLHLRIFSERLASLGPEVRSRMRSEL